MSNFHQKIIYHQTSNAFTIMSTERFKVKNAYFNNNVTFIDSNNRPTHSACASSTKHNGR